MVCDDDDDDGGGGGGATDSPDVFVGTSTGMLMKIEIEIESDVYKKSPSPA